MGNENTAGNGAIAIISLMGNIQTQVEESTLQGLIEDLPGVLGVEFPDDKIAVRFNSEIIDPRHFIEAIRRGGFVAGGYVWN